MKIPTGVLFYCFFSLCGFSVAQDERPPDIVDFYTGTAELPDGKLRRISIAVVGISNGDRDMKVVSIKPSAIFAVHKITGQTLVSKPRSIPENPRTNRKNNRVWFDAGFDEKVGDGNWDIGYEIECDVEDAAGRTVRLRFESELDLPKDGLKLKPVAPSRRVPGGSVKEVEIPE